MSAEMNRREFIKETLMASAAGALALGAGGAQAQQNAAAPALATSPEINPLPMGKIGDLQISRMIIGGNLLTFYPHARDLSYVRDLLMHYNNDEKILETLALAEQHGINTLSVNNAPKAMSLLQKHRARGGKIQWIICLDQPIEEDLHTFKENAMQMADMGAEAIYLQGGVADALYKKGRFDLIAKAVEIGKSHMIPMGVGGHSLDVVLETEKQKVPADFYVKTFHHHKYPTAPRPDEIKDYTAEVPGYWCKDPQAVIEAMKTIEKPWIAFKIMAAGAIPPKDAFPWAFENGADHILVGMFDWQLAEDARISREALEKTKNRTGRPWRS